MKLKLVKADGSCNDCVVYENIIDGNLTRNVIKENCVKLNASAKRQCGKNCYDGYIYKRNDK